MERCIQRILVLVFCLCLGAGAAHAQETQQAVVLIDNLNLRDGTSLSSNVIGVYPVGTVVTVLDASDRNNWYHVRTADGKEGYMSGRCLDVSGDLQNPEAYGYAVVNIQNLNLRDKAGTQSEVLGTYAEGTRVRVLDTENPNWTYVRTPEGTLGYMSAQCLNAVQEGLLENDGKHVNLRQGPSMDAAVIRQYESGTLVEVYGHEGEWSLVGVNGEIGYMVSYFIHSVQDVSESPVEQDNTYNAVQTVNSSLNNPYAFAVDGGQALVQQYGVSESYVDGQDGLQCTIFYPVSGLETADQQIRGWAQGLAAQAAQLAGGQGEGLEIEVTVQYDAYVVGGRYAGVRESGWMNVPDKAYSEDILYTMNIDLKTGELLGVEQIFGADRIPDVLAVLRQKLSLIDGDPVGSLGLTPDSTWLSQVVLTPDGVMVHLARGRYLPETLGTLMVPLTYDELEGAQMLAIERPLPQVDATAQTQYDAIQVQQRDIDPSQPMVALTFDDGPSATTPHILDLLTQYGGRATFFVVGNRLENYENELRQIAEQGSEIGNHTWGHKSLPKASDSNLVFQLQNTNEAIEAITGQKVRVMRPPYGNHNSKVRRVSGDLGMAVILWSIDTEDWKTRNAQATYDEIMKEVRDGSIILCHDLHEQTGVAMETVIPELVRRGYQLVTVSELLSYQSGGMVAGQAYFKAVKE